MLKSALRTLVPAGALALLALALTSETARAANECGDEAGGMATCSPSSGDFGDGITYEISHDEGFTLRIQARRNNVAREIKNPAYTGTSFGELGHGIWIEGTSGQGLLRLVVQGDTNLVRREAPSGANRASRNGIYMRNNGATQPVIGSIIIETGAEVDIGRDGEPFRDDGIFAIASLEYAGSDNSTAGVKITNAGKIYADGHGIRAVSAGAKILNPPEDHLNGKVEVTHSGLINARKVGIIAASPEGGDVTVTLQEGGRVTGGTGGIHAETSVVAGTGSGAGNIVISSAGVIEATSRKGIEARARGGDNNTVNVRISAGTLTAEDTGIHAISGPTTGATTITVDAGASVTGGGHGIEVTHDGTDVPVNINIAGSITGGDEANAAAIKITTDTGTGPTPMPVMGPTPVTVTLTDGFRINGDILFDGGEDDTVMLDVAKGETGQVIGDIMNIDDLLKTGMGMARGSAAT